MTTWSPHDKNTEYIAFFFNFTQTIFKTTWRDFYVSLSLFFSFTGDFYFYFIFSLFLSFLRLFYNNRQSICWGIGWHCLTTHTQTCNYTHGEREEDRMTNATSIVIFLHTVVSRSRLSGNKKDEAWQRRVRSGDEACRQTGGLRSPRGSGRQVRECPSSRKEEIKVIVLSWPSVAADISDMTWGHHRVTCSMYSRPQ